MVKERDETEDRVDATDLREFEDLLNGEGVHAALRFLNDRSGYRFTGVYRFDEPTLRNLHMFDRTNPDLELGSDAPLRETYCSMIRRTQKPLGIDDARTDPRTAEHPAKEATQSYLGVPLQREDGTPFGTLCHFDVVPRSGDRSEWPFMEAAARAIMRRLTDG